MHTRFIAGLASLLLGVSIALPSRSPAADTLTVWKGIYTAAQAERGQRVLTEHCAQCHGAAMRGGAGVPSAVGPEFMFNWDGKTVGELFLYLKTTMPPTAPGSLSDQRYADVMAALFSHNGFPASETTEIPADPNALSDVLIARKP